MCNNLLMPSLSTRIGWFIANCICIQLIFRSQSNVVLCQVQSDLTSNMGDEHLHEIETSTQQDINNSTTRCNLPFVDVDEMMRTTRRVPMMKFQPIIIPALKARSASIIFLHGQGQSGKTFLDFLQRVRQPYMRIICPMANVSETDFRNSWKMTSWFNFSGGRYPTFNEHSPRDIDVAANYVQNLMDREIVRGIHPSRIILGGYSQGAILALHAALTYQFKIGGLIIMSPWKPMFHTLETMHPQNRDIPIYYSRMEKDPYTSSYAHGVFRKYIPDNYSKDFYSKLITGYHTTSPNEFRGIKVFCLKYLPQMPHFRRKEIVK